MERNTYAAVTPERSIFTLSLDDLGGAPIELQHEPVRVGEKHLWPGGRKRDTEPAYLRALFGSRSCLCIYVCSHGRCGGRSRTVGVHNSLVGCTAPVFKLRTMYDAMTKSLDCETDPCGLVEHGRERLPHNRGAKVQTPQKPTRRELARKLTWGSEEGGDTNLDVSEIHIMWYVV